MEALEGEEAKGSDSSSEFAGDWDDGIAGREKELEGRDFGFVRGLAFVEEVDLRAAVGLDFGVFLGVVEGRGGLKGLGGIFVFGFGIEGGLGWGKWLFCRLRLRAGN